AQMIHLLEEKIILGNNYTVIVDESIRCHHKEICDYFVNNKPNDYSSDDITKSIHFPINEIIENFNYNLFPTKVNEELIASLHKHNYMPLFPIIIDSITKCDISFSKIFLL
ncbi:hypothetical protein M9Y10_002482, partial [Tritrichomonas musculus]